MSTIERDPLIVGAGPIGPYAAGCAGSRGRGVDTGLVAYRAA